MKSVVCYSICVIAILIYVLLPWIKGFDSHVQHDHSMWSYIYYSIYLDQIDTSDHNAIESYVYKMVRKFEFGV